MIPDEHVEALQRRIVELEKALFSIGHAATCISGDSLDAIPILKAALARESHFVLEREARIAELEAALVIAQSLVDSLETCHVCQGTLALDDIEPAHCEDCSGCCDEHEEPACEPLFSLHGRAKVAIRKALEGR